MIPIPPSVYRPLPGWMKKSVLLDFGMYRFDEEVDGRRILEEEGRETGSV